MSSVELATGSQSRDYIIFKLDPSHFDPDSSQLLPSPAFVQELVSNFSRGRILHHSHISAILCAMHAALLARAANIMDLPIPADGRIIVVGDLHGQLADLLTILRLNGQPSPSNAFVFNGDFVDRGEAGVEVTMLLFAMYLAHPGAVFLNRGNHECSRMNLRYHFAQEVSTKCAPHSNEIFQAYQAIFRLLPLITLIDHEIMVVHGGLYDVPGWDLPQIRSDLDRVRDIPITPPYTPEDLVMQGLLWSDPRPFQINEPSRRGAGIHFGSQLTNAWMQSNGVRILIRSHEMFEKGYELHHGLKVITVFSASRYCQKNDNFGAFLVISPTSKASPEVHRFRADAFPGLNAEFSFSDLVRDVIRQLGSLVFDHRVALERAFSQFQSPLISRIQWADTMKQVLSLPDIPFLLLQPSLVLLEENGQVNWQKYLSRFHVRIEKRLVDRLSSAAIWNVCLELFSISGDLRAAFQQMDKNGDGTIDYSEFRSVLAMFDLELTEQDIREIFDTIDGDRSGSLSIQEFSSTFDPLFQKLQRDVSEDIRQLLKELSRIMRHQSKSIKQAFIMFDTNRDGRLSYDELVSAFASLFKPGTYTPLQFKACARFMDADGNGEITFSEFRDAFRTLVKGPVATTFQSKAIHNLITLFRQNSMTILSAFACFDADFSGTISRMEFSQGLELFNDLLESPLDASQIDSLWECIDHDKNNEIDYHEFTKLFEIIDSNLNQS